MKLFIDTANIEEIVEVLDYGILDGVTTNPSLIKLEVDRLKSKGKKIDLESHIKDILKIVKGKPVFLEVIGLNYREMVKEALNLYKKFNTISKNIYIKIPVDPCLEKSCNFEADGIKAIKFLSLKRIPVNATLIFTPEQSLLAAKAGAKIVSQFVGREDDYLRELNKIKFNKEDYFPSKGIKIMKKIFSDNGIVSGVGLIQQTRQIFDNNKIKTEILAASIRNKIQFREVVIAGADITTMPYEVIKSLLKHHKTAEGMRQFTNNITKEYAKLAKK